MTTQHPGSPDPERVGFSSYSCEDWSANTWLMLQFLHPAAACEASWFRPGGLICDWWAAVNIHIHIHKFKHHFAFCCRNWVS